jgi:hypothetical protein
LVVLGPGHPKKPQLRALPKGGARGGVRPPGPTTYDRMPKGPNFVLDYRHSPIQDTLACAALASRCAHAAPSRDDSRSVDAVTCLAVGASLSGRLALLPLPSPARYSPSDGIALARRFRPSSPRSPRKVATNACRSRTAGRTDFTRLLIRVGCESSQASTESRISFVFTASSTSASSCVLTAWMPPRSASSSERQPASALPIVVQRSIARLPALSRRVSAWMHRAFGHWRCRPTAGLGPCTRPAECLFRLCRMAALMAPEAPRIGGFWWWIHTAIHTTGALHPIATDCIQIHTVFHTTWRAIVSSRNAVLAAS